MRKVAEVMRPHGRHWVGNGFPVRTLFSYGGDSAAVTPFLLFDYAGPHVFEPSTAPRGVGQHPHRGFETVTIVYDGEVAHWDSTGKGGVIGPGDVQWMTAASGILHEEFHSPGFTRTGGPFRMVQLWINLPAKDIPAIDLPKNAGRVRVIAGQFREIKGPAHTFTPINLWDIRLNRDADVTVDLPERHNAMIAVLAGHVTINGEQPAGEAEIIRLEHSGSTVRVVADGDSMLLVLTGEPIDEPVIGHGPFVMNNETEIRQAIDDYNAGRFGTIAA